MNKKMSENQITRKEAIKKMGKYAALTAVGTFLILSPTHAQSTSPPDPGGNPFPVAPQEGKGNPFGEPPRSNPFD